MDWITPLLANPLIDKAFAVVLVFVLLRFMREDMTALTNAMTSLKNEIAADRKLAGDQMVEVRAFMRELIQMWARTEERNRKP
jgi:hypothetical protein